MEEIIKELEKELKWANSQYAKAEVGGDTSTEEYYEDKGYCSGVVDTLINTLQTLKRANGEYK